MPEVSSAVTEALARWGNPSSFHAEGRGAVALKEEGRARVAALLNARPQEILFTSSGTEANAWALTGLAKAQEVRGRHLVVSAIEHSSILQTVRRMEKEGWEVTVVPVDRAGRVDPEELERALTPRTVVVSVQWANPEVGTVQPMAELVRRVKARGILFHTDAVAAAGRVLIDLQAVPADALSLAGNPLGGPGGVGALFLRKGARIWPQFVGGTQEEGRRAGTENLLGIVGMGKAAELAGKGLAQRAEQLNSLREMWVQGILAQIPRAVFHGHPAERLPGHLSVSFPGMEAESLTLALDLEGIAVGLGSACTARTVKASHVLKAMGVEEGLALGMITFSWGPETTREEIRRALEVLPKVALCGLLS